MVPREASATLQPPSAAAMDRALQVLLDSVAEENNQEISQTLPSADAKGRRVVLDELGRIHEALNTASHALYDEAHERMTLIARRRNSLVPIGRLPFELVVAILLLSISPDDDETSERHIDLSKVQSDWWHIIRASPAFWTKIKAGNARRVEAKLQRSGQLPLEVTFPKSIKEQELGGTLVLLKSQRHRVRSFTYHGNYLDPLSNFLNCPLPLLETLALAPRNLALGSKTLELREVPLLHELYLENTSVRWGSRSGLKLSRLKTLTLSTFTGEISLPREFAETLRSCSLLEELELKHIDIAVPPTLEDMGPPDSQPILLPKLQSFRIQRVHPLFSIPLLALIESNSLTDFTARSDDDLESMSITAALLDRPTPPPFLSTMLIDQRTRPEHIKIGVEEDTLEISADLQKGGRISILVLGHGHWLDTLGRIGEISLSSCRVPIHMEIADSRDEEMQDEEMFTVDLDAFTTMTSLTLTCDPRLALRTIEALRKNHGEAVWPCSNLNQLYVNTGGRDEWEVGDWCWEAIIKNLKCVVKERGSREALAAGVARLTIYKSRDLPVVVRDIDSLFPRVEDSEADSD